MGEEPEVLRESAEHRRLEEERRGFRGWRNWGTFLPERQWGTVREDYSDDGNCWEYFTHDHARSRAYRWGEDGLLGWCDRKCLLCVAPALWNGVDGILKERLFGLTNPEGNHGEDVKELYHYLDATPTHSYCLGLYRYPQVEFPYIKLVRENSKRGAAATEFEILDTGVFEDGRYFDVFVEYAKASPNDVLVRYTAWNRGPEKAMLHILPQVWFRNTWSWGAAHEGSQVKPLLRMDGKGKLVADHETLHRSFVEFDPGLADHFRGFLFTENVTNDRRLFQRTNDTRVVKDGFHEYVVGGRVEAVNLRGIGTKAAGHYAMEIPPGESFTVRLRLYREDEQPLGGAFDGFDGLMEQRRAEADRFYEVLLPESMTADERLVARQAYAGLLWSKQFYHYIVADWLGGDANRLPTSHARRRGRNADWRHLYARNILSMPDKWEYPWFAAWDLAFHMVPFARIDPEFAKTQLLVMLREWYMHPNGQIPAYEFALGDVNPPVHAWAAWRVYREGLLQGRKDRDFLTRIFQKLLLNFTWWVNRKDAAGHGIFAGGFLGLDNISIFDRSHPPPGGGWWQQADGTAWMAFYCASMLHIALELSRDGERRAVAYEDMASKFLEHFVQIVNSMNTHGGMGLWDEEDGFYYDQMQTEQGVIQIRTRSLVGLLPIIGIFILEGEAMNLLPGFRDRFAWFLENQKDLSRYVRHEEKGDNGRWLFGLTPETRLRRILTRLLDENEFLSPYGIRSLSKAHADHPFILHVNGEEYRLDYVPGESCGEMFGGNSNWRGPVWFPMNRLIIESLEIYDRFYGERFQVEFPTGSGRLMTLGDVAAELKRRLAGLFLLDGKGRRPVFGGDSHYSADPNWRDRLLFHEYFHGETGRGMGASHQTGWTALVATVLEDLARRREEREMAQNS